MDVMLFHEHIFYINQLNLSGYSNHVACVSIDYSCRKIFWYPAKGSVGCKVSLRISNTRC